MLHHMGTLAVLLLGFGCALSIVHALNIGVIAKTSLFINCSHLTMNTSTCSDCLCAMSSLPTNASIASLNCHTHSNVSAQCQLFTTEAYGSLCFYRMENNSNSTFYFKQLPSTNQSITTTTPIVCNASCLNQSWVSSSRLLASWSFDGTLNGQHGNYTLTPTNSPSFSTDGILRQSMYFNATQQQYLSTSYISLVNSSFTVNAWIKPIGFLHKHNSIFGVCQSAATSRCLHLTVRNYTPQFCLHFSFYSDNCRSYTAIVPNKWVHVAFAFDMTSMKRNIYINGFNDTQCSTASTLTTTNGNSTIGYIANIASPIEPNYFHVGVLLSV